MGADMETGVLEAGTYTLRLTRPMEFKPYVKTGVKVDGAYVRLLNCVM